VIQILTQISVLGFNTALLEGKQILSMVLKC